MSGPRDALSAALGRWNAGDLDGYLRLYDEGIRLHGYSPEPMDKEQVRSFYQGIFSAFGTPITLPGLTILHFRGDRVAERFSQADMLGLLVQIGAVPAPA